MFPIPVMSLLSMPAGVDGWEGWKDETIFSTATGTGVQGWMDGMES